MAKSDIKQEARELVSQVIKPIEQEFTEEAIGTVIINESTKGAIQYKITIPINFARQANLKAKDKIKFILHKTEKGKTITAQQIKND